MSFHQVLAFCACVAITSITSITSISSISSFTSVTPGPYNLMMLASGVNHAFVRSLPHLMGIGIGFSFMVLAMGLGLHAVSLAVPTLQTILKTAGAAQLLWLGWQLATAAPLSTEKPRSLNTSLPLALLRFSESTRRLG